MPIMQLISFILILEASHGHSEVIFYTTIVIKCIYVHPIHDRSHDRNCLQSPVPLPLGPPVGQDTKR